MAALASTATLFDPQSVFSRWQSAWRVNSQLFDLALLRERGAPAIAARTQQRLSELIQYARGHSPLYRDLYRDLPDQIDQVAQLPVIGKPRLMADFDRWVTDPRVTRAAVDRFVADPRQIGAMFLGDYAVWRSSGSSGVPGIFVHDRQALDIYDALVAIQLRSVSRITRYSMGLASAGGRSALIVATDGHFASIATAQRAQQTNPLQPLRVFSVSSSLESLIGELNDYQPAFVSSYPTALALLAQAQQAGLLKIRPMSLWSGGEFVSDAARELIVSAFDCPLINEYGASECLSIAFDCDHGALHLNADWVILEAVDRDYRPVPAGQASHTALLTNLANRIAPIIRYELGDSIFISPDRCECGSPLPAIQVEGRRDDVVTLCCADGRAVALLPLALATAVESASDVHRFQIIQTARDRLMLRLEARPGRSHQAAWHLARTALTTFLNKQGLENIAITLDSKKPAPDAASGKLRAVIALSPASRNRRHRRTSQP